MKNSLIVVLGFLILISVVWKTAEAASNFEVIKEFRVEAIINADSSLLIKEAILYDFGDKLKHGIFRRIPRADSEINILNVTDESENSYQYSVQAKRDYFEIKIGDPNKTIKGRHWYHISYKVKDEIRFFDDHDEFYWNVTGTEWEVPIEKSSIEIYLPQKIKQEDLQFECFTGPFGSKEKNCFWKTNEEGNIYFQSQAGLKPGEGLTIVLGWPKRIVAEPGIFEKAVRFFKKHWPLVIPVFVLIFVLKEWWQKGRDFPLKKPIIAQYEPPDNFGPAEVGTIIKQKVDSQDVSAIIIDLATRGYLKIQEVNSRRFLFEKLDYIFIRLKDFYKSDSLKDYEKRILECLFGTKESVTLSSLKNNFYLSLNSIKNKIYEELSRGSYFVARPDRIKKSWRQKGIILTFLGVALAIWWRFDLLISLGISGILFLTFSFFMPKRTKKGADAHWKTLGLKEYINTAEKYRVQFQEKEKIFEKYLSYAIVFGLAKKWAQAFEGIYTTPPSWYEGNFGPVFSTTVFSHSLNDALSGMSSTFISQPGGGLSGGSGFGGGGFSGGGGGGGGGGSW
jgi:uncharacterized membrane protein